MLPDEKQLIRSKPVIQQAEVEAANLRLSFVCVGTLLGPEVGRTRNQSYSLNQTAPESSA